MESNRRPKRKKLEVTGGQDQCLPHSVLKSANLTGSIRELPLETQSQLRIPSTRIKLQLFPLNDEAQLGLQKEGYNPYLELTLNARKKISSVVKHLTRKWSSSSIEKEQLMLFPYNINFEHIASCKRWTSNDTLVTAWEVYVNVGSPSVFRLRYGWHSNIIPEACVSPLKSNQLNLQSFSEVRRTGCSKVMEIPNHQDQACPSIPNEVKALGKPQLTEDDESQKLTSEPWDDSFTNLSIGGLLSEISLLGKINNAEHQSGLISEISLLGKISDDPIMKLGNESCSQPIFMVPPSDISVGGLFTEASLLCAHNGSVLPETTKSTIQDNALLSDSLDSLIATQMKSHSQTPTMSILDAEETCHAFPVPKFLHL